MCRNVQSTLVMNLRPSLVKASTHPNFRTAPQAKNGNHFFLPTSQKIDTFIDFFLIIWISYELGLLLYIYNVFLSEYLRREAKPKTEPTPHYVLFNNGSLLIHYVSGTCLSTRNVRYGLKRYRYDTIHRNIAYF